MGAAPGVQGLWQDEEREREADGEAPLTCQSMLNALFATEK